MNDKEYLKMLMNGIFQDAGRDSWGCLKKLIEWIAFIILCIIVFAAYVWIRFGRLI